MNEVKEFNENQKIAESTKLIRSMFDNTLTKRQMDLIYAVISLVKPTDEEFKVYHITYEAIGKIFNPANPMCEITINDIEKAVKSIVYKGFRMEDDKKIKYYSYVSKAEIDKHERYIEFRLDKDVQHFYLQLNKGEYTSYLLKDILALSTIFQTNLFRWLACNSGFDNVVSISIDDAALHFYGKDITNGELTRKIDSALEIINTRTNIKASYQKIKKGKMITHLNFYIENKYLKTNKTSDSQKKLNKERNKTLWEENIEMKKRIAELEAQLKKEEK